MSKCCTAPSWLLASVLVGSPAAREEVEALPAVYGRLEYISGIGEVLNGQYRNAINTHLGVTDVLVAEQKDPNLSIKWATCLRGEGEGAQSLVYTWSGASGGAGCNESNFSLFVNGQHACDFDMVGGSARFEPFAEGFDFRYKMLWRSDDRYTHSGAFFLVVPAGLVPPGSAATIEVKAHDKHSARWFGVFKDDRIPPALLKEDFRHVFPSVVQPPLGSALRKQTLRPIFRAESPSLRAGPALSLWQGEHAVSVGIEFPGIEGYVDVWSYESSEQFVSSEKLPGGGLELVHESSEDPEVQIKTTVRPEKHSVLFEARPYMPGATAVDSSRMGGLNQCFQFMRCSDFASAAEPYWAFTDRCCVFDGARFIYQSEIERSQVPLYPQDHPCNNPPWTQSYSCLDSPVGMHRLGQDTMALYGGNIYDGSQGLNPSTRNRPIIALSSRDGQCFAVLAAQSASAIHQAWLDCLHISVPWAMCEQEAGGTVRRVRLYLIRKGDLSSFGSRFERDFSLPGRLGKELHHG